MSSLTLQLLALIGDQFQKPGHICGAGMCVDRFNTWWHLVGLPPVCELCGECCDFIVRAVLYLGSTPGIHWV